jgi:hypothetical protein
MSEDDEVYGDDGTYGEDDWERRNRKRIKRDTYEDPYEKQQRLKATRDKRMFGGSGTGASKAMSGPGPYLLAALALGMYLVMTHWPQISSAISHKAEQIVVKITVPDDAVAVNARQVTAARKNLPHLAVHPRTGRGYTRAAFGPAWTDNNGAAYGHNGCGTRDDILRRDLTGETFRGRCVVITGTLTDPYTGKTIQFVKAHATAVQIDHLVALSTAWSEGAGKWSTAKRIRFANDPLNLLAVDGPTNEAKGDSGPAEWKPPSKRSWCLVAVRTVQVDVRYRLPLTRADRDALATMLAACPDPTPRSTP